MSAGSDAGTAGQGGGGAQSLDLPHRQQCCNLAHKQVCPSCVITASLPKQRASLVS